MNRSHLRYVTAASVVLAIAATGCAHYGIGTPPLETDLVNDGTPQAQRAMVDEYRIESKNGWINRPGGDPKKYNVDELKAKVASDEATEYLESSERAAKKAQTAAIGFDRTVNSSTFQNAIVLTIVIAGAIGGAVVAIPAVVSAATGPDRTNWDMMNSFGNVGWSMFGGGVGGCLASIPFSLLNFWLIVPLADAMAAADYKKAATAFNKDLEEKVRAAARPTAPAAGSAPALTPASELPGSAPASESAPAAY